CPTRAIQHSATCPSGCDLAPVRVPGCCTAYVETELAPASPTARRPAGAKVNANGTGVADGFATGVADRRPFGATWNTSIVLPLAFVVTSSSRPSGVKPTCPAAVRNPPPSPLA